MYWIYTKLLPALQALYVETIIHSLYVCKLSSLNPDVLSSVAINYPQCLGPLWLCPESWKAKTFICLRLPQVTERVAGGGWARASCEWHNNRVQKRKYRHQGFPYIYHALSHTTSIFEVSHIKFSTCAVDSRRRRRSHLMGEVRQARCESQSETGGKAKLKMKMKVSVGSWAPRMQWSQLDRRSDEGFLLRAAVSRSSVAEVFESLSGLEKKHPNSFSNRKKMLLGNEWVNNSGCLRAVWK